MGEKIMYFKNYVANLLNSKFFSYDEILEHGKKNNKLKRMINFYRWKLCDEHVFSEKKLVIKYNGLKKFIVGINTMSYYQIISIIDNICSKNNYETKIKQKFPNFIENVYFVTQHDEPFNILEILNECIEHNNNKITFSDISEICSVKNIISIKIIYVQKFKKKEKNINYNDYKNTDISILNNVFD